MLLQLGGDVPVVQVAETAVQPNERDMQGAERDPHVPIPTEIPEDAAHNREGDAHPEAVQAAEEVQEHSGPDIAAFG